MTSGESSLLRRVRAGGVAVGSFHDLVDPTTVEVACAAGVDFVVLECEHGVRSDGDIVHAIRAADVWGVDTLVRFDHSETLRMSRALEAGARGLIVPHVESAAEVEQILRNLLFPPRGHRGVGAYRDMFRSEGRVGWGPYAAEVEESLLLFPMIESIEAAEPANLEAILDIGLVTGLMAGPADIAGSLGFPGVTDSRVVGAVDAVVRATARRADKVGLSVVGGAGQADRYIEAGSRAILIGLDTILLDQVYRSRVSEIRDHGTQEPT